MLSSVSQGSTLFSIHEGTNLLCSLEFTLFLWALFCDPRVYTVPQGSALFLMILLCSVVKRSKLFPRAPISLSDTVSRGSYSVFKSLLSAMRSLLYLMTLLFSPRFPFAPTLFLALVNGLIITSCLSYLSLSNKHFPVNLRYLCRRIIIMIQH